MPVRYDELADLLGNKVQRPPDLITLNLYYSGARTARELVRRGVYAAIGFLDEIDDEFAERFPGVFTGRGATDRDEDHPGVFSRGVVGHGGVSDRMHGTAIVIWLGRSVFSGTATSPGRTIARPAAKKRIGGR